MPQPPQVQLMSSYTSQQWRILVILATCNFLSAIVWSLQVKLSFIITVKTLCVYFKNTRYLNKLYLFDNRLHSILQK